MFEINQLKPYVAFLLTVMGFIVLPAMFFTMGKNPLIWFFSDFIFKDLKRVCNFNLFLRLSLNFNQILFSFLRFFSLDTGCYALL